MEGRGQNLAPRRSGESGPVSGIRRVGSGEDDSNGIYECDVKWDPCM